MIPRRSLALILMLSCLSGTGCDRNKPAAPAATRESERQRTESVQAAFIDNDSAGSKAILPDSDVFRAIDATLAELGKAARANDRSKFFSLLSIEAMLRHLESAGMMSFRSERERKQMIAGVETGMSRNFGGLAFDRHQLVRLERVAPGQVLAFTRLYIDEMSTVAKLRWWLIEDAGAWKVYDYEDLDQGLRTSTVMGSMMAGLSGTKRPWVDPFVKFVQNFASAEPAELLEKRDEMSRLGAEILAENPPAEIGSFIRRTTIGALVGAGEFEPALEEIGRLDDQNGSPLIHFFRGASLAGLGKHAEAMAAYEAYAAELGWDRDLHEMAADCLVDAGDRDKALDHALKGLADHPDSPGCLATAVVAAGAARIGELEKHFKATSDPEGAYETAIDHALELEEEETARAAFALMKAQHPQSELIEIYEDLFSEDEPAGESDDETE